ncbi:MAG TPA: futalosine hydrolase [Flavobacteriales bacterium]|nr:futalosine hydrolase [Flavobacteriales bacterium]HIN39353.1 futalosine hydrolase [Flavobacteriales bacterium]
MKILLVSATEKEFYPLRQRLGFSGESGSFKDHALDLLVTGVGMVSTAYSLGKFLAAINTIDLVINLGIAGSFNRSFELGEVVNVTQDMIFELGAEDGANFIYADLLGLVDERHLYFHSSHSVKCAILSNLKIAQGITVNKVHGNQATINLLQEKNNPDVETMEGAAFFYACDQAKLSAIQLRSISNYVEDRDRSKWELDLAINNLASKTMDIIEDLS